MDIQELAEHLRAFFLVFDGNFLYDPDIEKLLTQTKQSLEQKINRNEAALPIITAMGGRYDGEVDRAKVKEVTALLDLIKARKGLQNATERENRRDRDAEASLRALFGI